MAVPLYQAKAEFFRTLGHPARIRVLELLSERDHAVHELLAAIDIEPSNLSQQLAVLRRAGLVVQRRERSEVLYAISAPDVRDLLLAAWEVCANAIEHAADPFDDVVRIRADVTDARVRIVVDDTGRFVPISTRPHRGLGLQLTEKLASAFDITTSERGTKVALEKNLPLEGDA